MWKWVGTDWQHQSWKVKNPVDLISWLLTLACVAGICYVLAK